MRILLSYIFIINSFIVMAQAPTAFTFQGIAMDENNELISNSNIGIRTSIIQDNPSGTIVYTEEHLVLSSDLGHFTLLVGNGNNISSDFNEIVWESNRHFIHIEMDVVGGTNYTSFSIVELLSVPFALVASTSLSGIPGPLGPQGITGPPGPEGIKGPQGAKGSIGPSGPICPAGIQGQPGPTGPPGPEGEKGMVGDIGPQGAAGLTGPQGMKGPQGFQGPQGIIGPNGLPGDQGPFGEVGEQGAAGPQGPEGPVGEAGPEEGLQGPTGPQGNPGPMGQTTYGAAGPTGENGFFAVEMRSDVPLNPSEHDIYLDSGNNRADGNAGFRYFNGVDWTDLY